MVSTASIICICIALALTTIIPAALVIWYCIKNKHQNLWLAALLGAAGFFVPQILIRVPILNLLSLSKGFLAFAENYYIIYAVILAATAAGFELTGRYGAAKILNKNGLTFRKAAAAGLAHGCIESVVIVGLANVNNLLYAVMINTGSFDTMINEAAATAGVDVSQYEVLKQTLIDSPAPMFLLGAYERGMTIISHLFMSILVFYFMAKHRTALGLLFCFLFHMSIDLIAAIGQGLTTPYLGEVLDTNTMYVFLEGIVTVAAIVSLCGILKIRKKWSDIHE